MLFLNQQNGDGIRLIVDFKRRIRHAGRCHESVGESGLFNGWHDANDLAFVGDFAGLGRHQMLFMNRGRQGGRVLIADFGAGPAAQIRYLEPWGGSAVLNSWRRTTTC